MGALGETVRFWNCYEASNSGELGSRRGEAVGGLRLGGGFVRLHQSSTFYGVASTGDSGAGDSGPFRVEAGRITSINLSSR